MTPAAIEALRNLRDPSHFQWYVVGFLAVAFYVYAAEVERKNWNLVFCGLAFWGMDWLNEIANALILHWSGRAPLWCAPGRSAYVIFVGLNIEICFMFAIAGIAVGKLLPADRHERILGIPNRLFIACTNSAFCVVVEILLNRGNYLVWEYKYWNVPHLWSIFLLGYLHFHIVAFWVHDMRRVSGKIAAVATIWGIAAVTGIGGLVLGWI